MKGGKGRNGKDVRWEEGGYKGRVRIEGCEVGGRGKVIRAGSGYEGVWWDYYL